MINRKIPYYNLILKCQDYTFTAPNPAPAYSIRTYQPGDEKAWASLEHGIGDFATLDEAEVYFKSRYSKDPSAWEKILFLTNEAQEVIGSAIAWQDPGQDTHQGQNLSQTVASLHWLVVDENYQGLGLGRALTQATLNIFAKANDFPIYIHTQPWSWPAILLYVSLGFKLQKRDSFAEYANEYTLAMEVLQALLTADQYDLLVANSED